MGCHSCAGTLRVTSRHTGEDLLVMVDTTFPGPQYRKANLPYGAQNITDRIEQNQEEVILSRPCEDAVKHHVGFDKLGQCQSGGFNCINIRLELREIVCRCPLGRVTSNLYLQWSPDFVNPSCIQLV